MIYMLVLICPINICDYRDTVANAISMQKGTLINRHNVWFGVDADYPRPSEAIASSDQDFIVLGYH